MSKGKNLYRTDPLEPDVYRSPFVAVCPTCKTPIPCPWGLFLNEKQKSTLVGCPECSELFSLTKEVEVVYVSRL